MDAPSKPLFTLMTSVPLAPLLEQWLAALSVRNRQPGTIRRYGRAVEAFLTWYEQAALQQLTLDHFTPALLLDYRAALHERQVIPPHSLNNTLEALRAWYAWLNKAYGLDHLPQDQPGDARNR